MPVLMGDDEGEERRDYTALFIRFCDCAGPQPSTNNLRSDEHAADCPYRVEVERTRREGDDE